MPQGLEIIAGRVTAPGAALTALTMNAGNSATIRNTNNQGDIKLLTAWNKNQTSGIMRIRSPRLHDNVQGIRMGALSGAQVPPLFSRWPQNLISQDNLTLELSGSATAGDIEMMALLVLYSDLPGIDGRFIGITDLMARAVNIVGVENTIATTATGDWGGEEAINAEYDLLKANTDYALLGYVVSASAGAVRWRGVDTGNLGVGGPCLEVNGSFTRDWFIRLSEAFQLPLIPVFNSANKAGILIDAMQDENGADITVQSIFAELA